VQGLTIINHYRNLHPSSRVRPFRDELFQIAANQYIGEMTSFDLYRLVLSAIINAYTHEQIKDLFYGLGEIFILPSHYQYLGYIEQIWPQREVIGIKPQLALKSSDKIAFLAPTHFVELEIETLQVNGKDRTQVAPEDETGIKLKSIPSLLKEGIVIYKVSK
jgi:hypothetical protein